MKTSKLFLFSIMFTTLQLAVSCDNQKMTDDTNKAEEVISNETAEPTLLGNWRLVNFEIDGNQKFEECDAQTIWNFSEDQVGNYQGKKLFRLTATIENPACRLYGFTAEWEEIDENATEVYIDNLKVGKGTNKGGVFKINELTTKTLILQGGTWVYYLER